MASARLLLAFCLSAAVAAAACSGTSTPPPDTGDPATDTPEPAVASMVNATVVVNKCPDAPRVNIRMAEDAIRKLVGPCATVPGGRAHFSATLKPGGRIELAAPDGDPGDGVVPTCVLQNRLVHRVLLKSPCALDVQLDERQMTVPVAPATATPSAKPSAAPTAAPTAPAAPTGSAAPTAAPSASAAPNGPSYVACGCGCCGGSTPVKKCLFRSKGDDLAKIIAADKRSRANPKCALAGCSLGTEYSYCD